MDRTKNLFAWFDWDDNTTSINSINIIKEPRKEFHLYQKGDEVIAKLPKYGLWNGVIVEIGDSKKDLELQMDKRQKMQLQQGTTNCSNQNEEHDHISDDESEEENTALSTKMVKKSQKEQKKSSKSKNVSVPVEISEKEAQEEKLISKKRKKEIDQKKLGEVNKALQQIIEKRRQEDNVQSVHGPEKATCDPDLQSPVPDVNTSPAVEQPIPVHEPYQETNTHNRQPQQQSRFYSSYTNDHFNQETSASTSTHQMQPATGYGYNYLYQQDPTASTFSLAQRPAQFLDSSPYSTYRPLPDYNFSTLLSHGEQLAALEKENAALRAENQQLRQKLDSIGQNDPGIQVTPGKLKFLRDLYTELEDKHQIQNMNKTSSKDDAASYHYSTPEESMSSLPLLVKPKPTRSLFKNTVTSAVGAPPSSPITELPSTPLAVRVPEAPINTDDKNESGNGYERSSSTCLAPWEEAVTVNGAPKIRLIPDVEVYLTPQQLAQAVQKAGNNPRKLVINLLEVFFSKETLAVSSAKGQRSAHNNKSVEKTSALPVAVVTAIKGFAIKHLKKTTGQCPLSDAVMNDVINSKCATARRAIQKACCPRNSEDNLN